MGLDETTVSEYRVFVVKDGSEGSFDEATASAMSSDFVPVTPIGSSIQGTATATSTDTDGDLIVEDQLYSALFYL